MPQFNVEQALQTARQHHQAGQLGQAEALYRQILQQQPNHADALHLLGVIAYQVGRHDVAVDLIRRAIALRPDYPEAYSNLGNALKDQGRLDEAIAALRQAIALRPGEPQPYIVLANALQAHGQLDAAIAACRQAIALNPRYPEAYCNLGNALQAQAQLDAAIAAYRQAISLNPGFAEAHSNLGNVLQAQGQRDAAIAAYHQAIALRPNNPPAYNNLAVALRAQGRLDAAIDACRHAIALDPRWPDAYNNLGNFLHLQGQLDAAIAAFRQAAALAPDNARIHSSLLYTLQFHAAYDAPAVAEEHRRWNLRHAAPLRKLIQPHPNDRSPQRRLRIGYVSPDFREHPVGRFMLPLLAHHDKNQFEVFAYAQVPAADALTHRLRSHADAWRSIVGLSDAQVADAVRGDQIDILVDLTMHMGNNRLLVFARKPAPVQVTYLAYVASTGLETIDYRLSDPYLDPPDRDESVYSERTIRLPETYWCYQPAIAPPVVGPLPALRQGAVTLGCLNNFCKISEPTLAAWAKLLRAVPDAQLLLHALDGSHRQYVQERLKANGIEPQRVQFTGFMPGEKYFDLYQRIDIALDTFPYGGGTTTCDALWMGVPVVSLVGSSAVGRGGLSILSNVGLQEFAGSSEEDYVRIARDLAGDLSRLSQLRSTLRQRMEHSPLMDAPRFARHVEAAYRQMWRQWCAPVS